MEICVWPLAAGPQSRTEIGGVEGFRDLGSDLEHLDSDRRPDGGEELVGPRTAIDQSADRMPRGIRHESAPSGMDRDHGVPSGAGKQDGPVWSSRRCNGKACCLTSSHTAL